MKSKVIGRARAGIWVVLGMLLVGACGKATSGSGSNTNWLKPCDSAADCGGGAECWCNVCAAPCSASAACSESGATCQVSAGKGCGESSISSSICVAACETSNDCYTLGASLACVKGACVAAANDVPGS